MAEHPEYLQAQSRRVAVRAAEVRDWCARAAASPRKRYRLLAHQPDDSIHEMLICLDASTYVQPHKHPGKTISLHTIEGFARLLLFDEFGAVTQQIPLGPYASGQTFYYRIGEEVYYAIVIESDVFVVLETIQGPFRRDETVYAPWAPDETQDERMAYSLELKAQLHPQLHPGYL